MGDKLIKLILEPIRDLLVENVKLLLSAGDGAKALRRQLKDMKSLLEDADRKQEQSRREWLWMADMTDLQFRAEDVIEEHEVRRLPTFIRAKEIQNLKSKLEEVINKMKAEGIDGADQISAASVNNQDSSRKTSPDFERGDCFVGMKGELEKLVSLLDLDQGNQELVISVLGMAGIGKTTIAKHVYGRMIADDKFDAFAWVCITQQCHPQSVLEDVLQQLTSLEEDEISLMSQNKLIKELHDVQRAKRCFIVLDDIWQIAHWDQLKRAFNVKDFKTKILVTTRNFEVAKIGPKDSRLELELLTVDDAWELLKRKTFPHGNIPDGFSHKGPDHACRIGKEMVRKCGRLPLAICLLGGVLSEKNSMRSWELVNENMDKYLREEGKDKELDAVVKLSYDDLPYHLKLCFLYLSVLREDESMRVGVLYRMWIAQGMISDENCPYLMNVAELYLSDLASRSIVQVEVDDGVPTKKFKTCKLHDAVRKLCLSMGKKADNRVEIVEYTGGSFADFLGKAVSEIRTRHLVIYCKKELEGDGMLTISGDDDNCKSLRSLHIYNDMKGKKTNIVFQCNVDFRKFRSLRSLVFHRFKFVETNVVRRITGLAHLRHLCFLSCEIEKGLPSSIKELVFLDTLDLYGSLNIRIPNDLEKMLRLKHLFLPRYDKEINKDERWKFGKGLDQLESLMEFNSSVHEVSGVTKMMKLQRFSAHIHDNESLSAILTAIDTQWNKLVNCMFTVKGGCHVTSTELQQAFACRNLHNLGIHVHLGKLLTECGDDIISSNLVCLVLLNCEIEEDPMEILGELPSLTELIFKTRSFVGDEMTCRESSFRSLRLLKILDLPNLRQWRVDVGAMPLLSELHICDCPALMVPEGLGGISTLKKLILNAMPLVWKKALATREDLRHIRSCITSNPNY